MDVKLVMFKTDGQRREFTLADGVSVIGRDEGCELRVPLGEVSRRHAEFEVSGATPADGALVCRQRPSMARPARLRQARSAPPAA